MKLRRRYALIVFGFLLFIVLAPIVVFGIRGYIYDFKSGQLVKTGIVVVKTEPRDAIIRLEGNNTRKEDDTPKTFRFVRPGDYRLTITKDGYYSWTKRLSVIGNGVTWATNGDGQKLVLLPYEPKLVKESSEYEDKDKDQSPDYIYTVQPSIDNAITSDIVRTKVSNPDDRTILYSGIPSKAQTSVYAAPNSLVFVIINRGLYQVNTKLDYLADGVDFVSWDSNVNKLVYGNNHELNLYNPFDPGFSQRELISRSSETGTSYCFAPDLGYMFRSYGKVIKAIELDGRNERNMYDVLKSENNLEIINCNKAGSEVIIKDGNTYKTYSFRTPEFNLPLPI